MADGRVGLRRSVVKDEAVHSQSGVSIRRLSVNVRYDEKYMKNKSE